MRVCIFEDFFIPRLAPVNYLRHTSEIICGAFSLREKVECTLGKKTKFILHSRSVIADHCREKFPRSDVNTFFEEDCLFLNSRVLFNRANLQPILKAIKKEKDVAWVQGKFVAAFFTSPANTVKIGEVITHTEPEYLVSYSDIEWLELKTIETSKFTFVNYASDLVLHNDAELRRELSSIVQNRKKVNVSPKSKIAKSAVLDSSEGPIYIGKDCVIEPNVYIKGPVYIGEHSTIRAGASIYGPVSIGSNCKLNGEITCSVIHSYVNKQHHGFLGHSYLAEWVNLGAGTTTSNLKNNYSKIVIDILGDKVNTESIFLGSIVGDHTKSGINTMLNTGTQVGISSNLFGSGYQNKFIPSFSWSDANSKENVVYDIEKALETAQTSMARRNVTLSPAYEKMIRHIFENRDKKPI